MASNDHKAALKDKLGHAHAVVDSFVPPVIDNLVHSALPCLSMLQPSYCNPAQNQHVANCCCDPKRQSQPNPKPGPTPSHPHPEGSGGMTNENTNEGTISGSGGNNFLNNSSSGGSGNNFNIGSK